jgi:NAD(P)-dependent dehydrogenase (short-subunit alcohol dehydrogenase family)
MKRRAIITGGARRLGKAMALNLAEQGIDIVVHFNSSSKEAEETRDDARKNGVNAEILRADLLDMSDTIGLISKASILIGGPFDILINNASIFEHDNLETVDLTSWNRHLDSNLRSAVFLTQEFSKQAPKMINKKNELPYTTSNVINIIDQRVRKITPDFMSYTTAKIGLWGFTQSSAQFLAPNIRVNAIGPGPTLQGIRQSKDNFENQRLATPLMRGANELDITNAMNYILNAYSVTGQLICLDGGQHLAWKTADVAEIE